MRTNTLPQGAHGAPYGEHNQIETFSSLALRP